MNKEDIIAEINEVKELLYQQKDAEGYQKLNQLIGHFSIYVSSITETEKQMDILETLKEALEAMENKDTTLLADVLQYELLEKL